MSDELVELAVPCESCGAGGPVNWSPLWGLRLCYPCRSTRTEAEVKVTVGRKPARVQRVVVAA